MMLLYFYSIESTAACPVHRVGEGELVVGVVKAKASPRLRATMRIGEGEGVLPVIKLLLVVQVDATHHSTGPTCLPLNLAKRAAVYNIFAATSNIYPTTN